MPDQTPDPTPAELRVREGGRVLRVSYAGGMTVSIAAERLRAATPSADKSEAPAGVTIVGVESVGNYAARFVFSDGHDSGVCNWTRLRLPATTRGGAPQRSGGAVAPRPSERCTITESVQWPNL